MPPAVLLDRGGRRTCGSGPGMTPSSYALLELETLFHERYRVIRCIKAGAMGAVYEVADQVTDRRRALKVMLPGAINDPELRARFAQEAKITGNVESDHIVEVFDAGVDAESGTPFLVMDLLRGEELGTMSTRRGALPMAEVVLYLTQVAVALDKTHAAAIVHRDLKPENLFLTSRDDGTPCVKILDFGVAKIAVQGTLATRTAMVGTPLYMAPEQIRGDGSIGPSADIYALGHIAFGLLVGCPYWMPEATGSPSIFALLHRILAGLPEAPSVRAARRGIHLSPFFDAWFQRATAATPEERFGSATEAVMLLVEALAGASPPAPPPPPAPSSPGLALDHASRRSSRTLPERSERPQVAPAPPAPAAKAGPGRVDALKVVAANGDPVLGKCFPLTQSPTFVGSGIGNHIVLDHASIARKHAVLERRSEGWVLRTYERSDREVPLQLGDRVKVGPFILRLVDYAVESERYDLRKRQQAVVAVSLELVLKDAFLRAREDSHGLTMVMFEIGQVQRIEEAHGRAAVESGLHHLVTVLERRLREIEPDGVLARHNRGVFALLLPTKIRSWARFFATLAFGESKKYPLRISLSQEVQVDIRTGMAQLQESDRSWQDMLDRGLRALGRERLSNPG